MLYYARNYNGVDMGVDLSQVCIVVYCYVYDCDYLYTIVMIFNIVVMIFNTMVMIVRFP